MKKLKFASFFAGIGGFDLGFERAGFKSVMQCEIDPYCQAVLRRHWPKVQLHDDIQTLNASTIPEADIWTAGWPCQDLSNANTNRQGLKGKRSGLFFDFSELARTCRPTWLVLENVAGLLSAEQGTALETVVDELEKIGYLGGWFSFNTLDAGLPQNRERVFIVASYQSDRAYQFFTHGGSVFGDTEKRERAGRVLDPHFQKALSETLRFWFNVAEVSGTPWLKVSAPRFVPKLENIKEVILTDQFYVARNLTWNECEGLMGFPEGWTVAEGDSLATQSLL